MRIDTPGNSARKISSLCKAAILLSLFSILLSVPTYAQEPDSEESGDEIIARDLYFTMKRAGGPGYSIPQDAYARAAKERVRLEQTINLSNNLFSATWAS